MPTQQGPGAKASSGGEHPAPLLAPFLPLCARWGSLMLECWGARRPAGSGSLGSVCFPHWAPEPPGREGRRKVKALAECMITRLKQRDCPVTPHLHQLSVWAGWEVGWGGERLGGGEEEEVVGNGGGVCAQKVLLLLHFPPGSISLRLTVLFLGPRDLFSHLCSLPILARSQLKFQRPSLEMQAKPWRQGPCCSPPSPGSCPAWAVLPRLLVVPGH